MDPTPLPTAIEEGNAEATDVTREPEPEPELDSESHVFDRPRIWDKDGRSQGSRSPGWPVMAAAATGLSFRAKSLFRRAVWAEADGELHQALKLYDQGLREASSSLRGNPGDTSTAIAARLLRDGYLLRKTVLSKK